jgi:20S proteasome alpha/beta subunit
MISLLAKPIPFPAIPKRLQKRKPVTIAAGFKFKDGVLVCADTQYTSPSIKLNKSKMSSALIGSDKVSLEVVFAMSGTDGHMQMAMETCEDAVGKCDIADSGFIYEARNQCADALANLYAKHFYPHKLYEYQGGPNASLIIGIYVTGEGTELLWTSESAVAFVDKYQVVGSGADLARYAIDPLFMVDMTLEETILLAVHALRVAKKGDPNCGGTSEFAVLLNSGLGTGIADLTIPQESYSETFENIMRTLFFAGSDMEMAKHDIGAIVDDVKAQLGTIINEQRKERNRRQKLMSRLLGGSL